MDSVPINNRTIQQEKEKSLLWFNFYVYFRLPAGIVVSIVSLFSAEVVTLLAALLALINIAVSGILFWGLKERKLWAWKMNFAVLVFDTIVFPFAKDADTVTIIELIVYVVIVGIFWLLPNWIYFKKREYLFHGPTRLPSHIDLHQKLSGKTLLLIAFITYALGALIGGGVSDILVIFGVICFIMGIVTYLRERKKPKS